MFINRFIYLFMSLCIYVIISLCIDLYMSHSLGSRRRSASLPRGSRSTPSVPGSMAGQQLKDIRRILGRASLDVPIRVTTCTTTSGARACGCRSSSQQKLRRRQNVRVSASFAALRSLRHMRLRSSLWLLAPISPSFATR